MKGTNAIFLTNKSALCLPLQCFHAFVLVQTYFGGQNRCSLELKPPKPLQKMLRRLEKQELITGARGLGEGHILRPHNTSQPDSSSPAHRCSAPSEACSLWWNVVRTW